MSGISPRWVRSLLALLLLVLVGCDGAAKSVEEPAPPPTIPDAQPLTPDLLFGWPGIYRGTATVESYRMGATGTDLPARLSILPLAVQTVWLELTVQVGVDLRDTGTAWRSCGADCFEVSVAAGKLVDSDARIATTEQSGTMLSVFTLKRTDGRIVGTVTTFDHGPEGDSPRGRFAVHLERQ